MKKIFITGGTGFLGANLIYKFLKEGFRVYSLVRKTKEDSSRRIEKVLLGLFPDFDYQESKKNIRTIEGDITLPFFGLSKQELEDLKEVHFSAIFHCAAFMSFSEKDRSKLFLYNVEGTRNALNLASKLNIPSFHYISTAYVCGKFRGKFREDDLDKGQEFNNFYEETKFCAEKVVKEYKDKLNINIYRPSIILGDSKEGRTANFRGYYSVIRAMCILKEKTKIHLEKDDIRLKDIGAKFLDLDKDLIYTPIRLAWLANKPLNLVPIDYVREVIFEIFKKNVSNKNFHITNSNPPRVKKILKFTYNTIGLKGFKIVKESKFKNCPISFLERFFSRNIKNYLPYLKYPEAKFTNSNTRKIVKNFIKTPLITQNFINKIVEWCLKTEWGKNVK